MHFTYKEEMHLANIFKKKKKKKKKKRFLSEFVWSGIRFQTKYCVSFLCLVYYSNIPAYQPIITVSHHQEDFVVMSCTVAAVIDHCRNQ